MFSKNNYVDEDWFNVRMDQVDRRLSWLENKPEHNTTYAYDAMIALLVEAGILIEDDKVGKGYVTRNNKTYRVKKVK